MLASSRDVRGRWVVRSALLVALVVGSGLSAQRARACSGPFYSGPATVPFSGSVGVPVNALIQVRDEGDRDDALEVTLWADGAPHETLTLARQSDRGWFVGAPTVPLAAHTEYDVRVDRALFCSWLPLATISYECQPSSPLDEPVVLTSFRTSDVVDQLSPVAGEGRATFTYGELVRIGVTTCAGSPQGSYVWVSADERGWVASDDGGIAGYRLVRDGEVGTVLQPTPFPREIMRCSGEVRQGLLPGTYQVVAEDYLGNLSMLSGASVLLDGCPAARDQAGCSVSPDARPAPCTLVLAVLTVLGAALRTSRRSSARRV